MVAFPSLAGLDREWSLRHRCILFICIEAIQGGEANTIRLYGQNIHPVLTSRAQMALWDSARSQSFVVRGSIIPILVRLGAIAVNIFAVPLNTLLRDTEHQYALTQGSPSFRSAEEAIVVLATEVQIFQRLSRERVLNRDHRTSPVPRILVIQHRTLSVGLQS